MKPVTVYHYKLPPELQKKIDDLKKNLDRECTEFLQKDVRSIAANYGAHNVPDPAENSIEPSIEQLRGFFMRKNTDISLELQGAIQEQIAVLNIHTAKDESESHQKEIDRLKGENLRDLADLSRIDLHIDKQRTKKFDRVLTGLTVLESVGYTLTYLRMGDNFLLAAVWGVLLAIAQTWGIKLFVIYLRDHLKTSLSLVSKVGIIVVLALILWALGTLRLWSVQGNTGNVIAMSSVSLLMFVIITLLLIGVVAGFTYIYYPTKDESALIRQHDEFEKKIANRNKQIEILRERINTIKAETNIVAQMHQKIIEATKDMHKRMQAFFKQAVGAFKLENRIKRTDQITPRCFNNPIKPLNLGDDENDSVTPQIGNV